jgi:hypothetical protein
MKAVWTTRFAIAALLVTAAVPANAQGKSKGKGAEKKTEKTVVVTSRGEVAAGKKADKAAHKRVTTSQAVVVTRNVLVSNGYQVVNVVPSGTTQVIYFRRGNRGNGRGLGPVEKIYVVPSGDIVTFRSVPESLLSTILRQLGLR